MKTTPRRTVSPQIATYRDRRRRGAARSDVLYRAYLAALALAHRAQGAQGARATAHYHRADRYLDAFERARAAERRRAKAHPPRSAWVV